MSDPATARLLEFMAPGFLHGMGNALFAIQSHAQVTDAGPEIVAGCANASAVLEVLRLLAEPDGDNPVGPAGAQLRTVVDLMRVGVRDSGMAIEVADEVFAATDRVPRRTFVRAVVLATDLLHRALPTGCQGRVRLSWLEPGAFLVEFAADPTQLPFDVDLVAAEAAISRALTDTAFAAHRHDPGPGLVLILPKDGDPSE